MNGRIPPPPPRSPSRSRLEMSGVPPALKDLRLFSARSPRAHCRRHRRSSAPMAPSAKRNHRHAAGARPLNEPWHPRVLVSNRPDRMIQGGRYGLPARCHPVPVLLRRSGKPPCCWPYETEQPQVIVNRGPRRPPAIRPTLSSTFILPRQPAQGRGVATCAERRYRLIFRRWRCHPPERDHADRGLRPHNGDSA